MQPLLVVFEDLHWIDSETQALLDALVESLPAARVLLLVNYRPEYRHQWGSRTYYTQLRLDPLPHDHAEELLGALVGSDAGLDPLKRVLIERTEGNPFFLEESVRSLVETGSLVGERGAYRLARPLPTIQVPATVQAVLAARIDRLPPADRALLQTASVVGKDVPLGLLQAIAEPGRGGAARRDRAASGRRVPLRDAHVPGRRVHVQACPDARRHLRRPAPGSPPPPARPDRGDDRAALSRPARRARRAAGPPRVSGRGVGEGGRLPAAGRGQGPGPVRQPGGRHAPRAGARGVATPAGSLRDPGVGVRPPGRALERDHPARALRAGQRRDARRRRCRGAARRPAPARSSRGG